jgi:tetratricopeptide (TPR) repeat protein
MAAYWFGQPQQGIDYGRRAVHLLARTSEHYRLGMAYGVLALHYCLSGDYTQALQAATVAEASGASSREKPLQAFAAWTMGWIYATCGTPDAGIAACQRAVGLAADPLSTALAEGWLGYAYLEKGEIVAAIPHLEQAVQGVQQYNYRRIASLFTTFLGATYLLRSDLAIARTLALRGLSSAMAEKYQVGIGWAQRILGQIAHVARSFEEAEHHLSTALTTFTALSARLEIGRTRLALADLAYHQGQHGVAVAHVTQAYHLFKLLQIRRYMEHTRQQARLLNLPLSDDTA